MTAKIPTNIRLSPELRRSLEAQALTSQCSLTDLIERYASEGLVRDQAHTFEQGITPIIRKEVQDAISWGLSAVYKRLWSDIQKEMQADRVQIALAAKNTVIVRRLAYYLLSREFNEKSLQEIFAAAVIQAEKEIKKQPLE